MRHILKRLLPADYREQVLGDLHERGYRFRDIGVLPRVWVSYLVRIFTAPAPQGAGITDAALHARTEQLARQGPIAFYAAYASIWVLTFPFRGGPHRTAGPFVAFSLSVLLCAIPAYYASMRRAFPDPLSLANSRQDLLNRYRRQIDYQLTRAKSMLYLPSGIAFLWLVDWFKSRNIPEFLIMGLIVTLGVAALASRRISNLRRELDSLHAFE